jgi:regulator of replication initiation timing
MGILDNAKQVAESVHEIHNLELYQRVLNLHSDIIAIVEENNRLRNENGELSKTISLRKDMNFKEPFYYRDGDETPYCAACYEAKDKAIHLTFVSETRWDCPSCQHNYFLKKNMPSQPTTAHRMPYGRGPNSWMGR